MNELESSDTTNNGERFSNNFHQFDKQNRLQINDFRTEIFVALDKIIQNIQQ